MTNNIKNDPSKILRDRRALVHVLNEAGVTMTEEDADHILSTGNMPATALIALMKYVVSQRESN